MKKKIQGTPTMPKAAQIVDLQGNYYHPTKAPEGLCKCGVMLELKTKTIPYTFASKIRAAHAREHTLRYLKNNSISFEYDNFIVREA